MISPNNKLFRWGPIDGRLIYPGYWFDGFDNFLKDYPPGWPAGICFFNQEKFSYTNIESELYNNGVKVFYKYIFDDLQFKRNYKRWNLVLKNLKIIIKKIKESSLSLLSNEEFKDLVIAWRNIYAKEFWNVGCVPEVANYGGEKLLPEKLRKIIKSETNFNLALERLSAPEDFSFYQREELDLLKLKKVKNKKLLESKLKEHQKKYFWILNSYHHTKVLPISYFKKRLSRFSEVMARKKISDLEKTRIELIKHKNEVIKKFKLSKEIKKISKRLSFCIWWQDLRKTYIFQANHIVDFILKEASRRFKLSFNDLHYYNVNEIENLVKKGKKISGLELSKRKKYLLAVYDPKKGTNYYSGSKTKTLFKPYEKKKINNNLKEFKGLVVNRGIVRGVARIIHSPREINKMKKGDILVAPMTSPDFIIALKRASAVVTDEGGMTCHAAIVARELKIPGIVGTRIATKILKDGDRIEVDANKGIIKIIHPVK